MDCSLNETEALCKRAARGAGFSWGMASEAATAARWLASFGLPGPSLLVARLALADHHPMTELQPVCLSGEWHGGGGTLCPIIAGVTLMDCRQRLGDGQQLSMHGVLFPLLLVPFAAKSAIDMRLPVVIHWREVSLCAGGNTLSIEGDRDDLLHEAASDLGCRTARHHAAAEPRQSRASIDTGTWDRLSTFAERTYAPASEESRRLGAG